jgi:hypothetical protein
MLPLEFQFPFDRREWMQAFRAVLAVTVRRRWWLYGVIALIFLAAAGLPIAAILTGREPAMQAALSALPWVVLIVFWVWLFYFGAPWWAARQIERKYPAFAGQQSRIFTSSGVRWISPGSTQDLQWSAIYRVVETPRFVLLFPTMSAAQFVPKRVMTPDHLAQLRELLIASLSRERLRLLPSAA